MPVRPELLVRDADGIPMPPVELAARLHQRIGAEWNLRYLSASWAVTRDWPPTDRRHEWIKTGETDPRFAWDIIGYLPLTCGVDEAPAYLERMLKSDGREEIRRRVDAVRDWNTVEQPKQTVETVLAATHDALARSDDVTSAVYAVTPATTTRKRRTYKTVIG